MSERGINGARGSRQLWAAAATAMLSPAAALAGTGRWHWLLIWCALGLALAWALRGRLRRPPGRAIRMICTLWGVLLAARVLERTAQRLELASGGKGQRVWFLLLLAAVLAWMCRGGQARFCRGAELLWPIMAFLVAAVHLLALPEVDWSLTLPARQGLAASALAAGEILGPAVLVLPYIYNEGGRGSGWHWTGWLAFAAMLASALAMLTRGLLGGAAQRVEEPFFVAAGLIGGSARLEGLLSALWLMSDLVCLGLLCLPLASKKWGSPGAAVIFALALAGISEIFPPVFWAAGAPAVLLLAAILPTGGRK